ncbi:hypothetical protein Q9966_010174 [Columba livia]|nr:hypothetical protein Q9966_010174 [Columba livia]
MYHSCRVYNAEQSDFSSCVCSQHGCNVTITKQARTPTWAALQTLLVQELISSIAQQGVFRDGLRGEGEPQAGSPGFQRVPEAETSGYQPSKSYARGHTFPSDCPRRGGLSSAQQRGDPAPQPGCTQGCRVPPPPAPAGEGQPLQHGSSLRAPEEREETRIVPGHRRQQPRHGGGTGAGLGLPTPLPGAGGARRRAAVPPGGRGGAGRGRRRLPAGAEPPHPPLGPAPPSPPRPGGRERQRALPAAAALPEVAVHGVSPPAPLPPINPSAGGQRGTWRLSRCGEAAGLCLAPPPGGSDPRPGGNRSRRHWSPGIWKIGFMSDITGAISKLIQE